jgi:hypothetical protein
VQYFGHFCILRFRKHQQRYRRISKELFTDWTSQTQTHLIEIGPSWAFAFMNRLAETPPETSSPPMMGMKVRVRDVAFWKPMVLFAGM